MDPAYVQQMMQAIVAFELEVLSIRHVFKLSQNRDRQSQTSIMSKLREQGGDAAEIALAMDKKNKIVS
jgi:transcriptional regulator